MEEIHMNKHGTIAVLLAALLLSACTGSLAPGFTLEGSAWILTHIQGNPILPGTTPTLSFDSGQVSGNGSCNSFGGEYKQSGRQLTIGTLMSTMMACMPAGLMDQEQAYLAALQAAAGFTVEAGRLKISDSTGTVILVFSPQDTALEGKTWQMVSYRDETGSLVPVVTGSRVTAEFAGGALSGSAGCNHYSASYTHANDTLSIQPTTITEMYCEAPTGVMEQETQFLNVLAQTSSCQVDFNRLTLFDQGGNTLAEFELNP
jgi:heat shock protein HslJ